MAIRTKVQHKKTTSNHFILYSAIPMEIRNFLGIKKSDELRWTKNDNGTVTIEKERE